MCFLLFLRKKDLLLQFLWRMSPLWGRSAGPDFSAMRNRGKNRQRRGLSPPCGIHPAVLGVPASSLFRPLAWWGHIDDLSFYGLYLLLCSCVLLLPGLTLACNCSQLPEAWLPAAETPHTGVRPWKQMYSLTEKGMRSIDLPGHLCDPTGARAGHRNDAGPTSYPKGGS